MVCGGFACSRNALCALNVVYVLVGVLLVAVAGWGRGLAGGSSPPLLGGAFAVGVFLLLIAALGLLGALRHHQVLLFFYVLILGLVFLCQLGVSCACLALGRDAQERLLRSAWPLLSGAARAELQLRLGCCGLGEPPGTPARPAPPPGDPRTAPLGASSPRGGPRRARPAPPGCCSTRSRRCGSWGASGCSSASPRFWGSGSPCASGTSATPAPTPGAFL
ncbi:LOW QUALITY PROTEIN: tetraspanin-31 [Passerculus sandwichensis]